MRITILNGNPNTENAKFNDYLRNLSTLLRLNNHTVTILQLRDMDIRYCIGCFGCWVKTPGECSNAADDTHTIRREFINSNLVLFASPIIMGFTSALLKKAHDRLIPLLLPYSEVDQWEVHHVARYGKYPQMGLLLGKNKDTDEEDIEIIADIYVRDAINFKTSFCFTKLITGTVFGGHVTNSLWLPGIQ